MFTLFTIEVRLRNGSSGHYRIKRRYREFQKLHEDLARKFARVELPPLPTTRFGRAFDPGYLATKQVRWCACV